MFGYLCSQGFHIYVTPVVWYVVKLLDTYTKAAGLFVWLQRIPIWFVIH